MPTNIRVRLTGIHPGTMAASQDAFVPGATGAVPQEITPRDDHPVPKKGVVSALSGKSIPMMLTGVELHEPN